MSSFSKFEDIISWKEARVLNKNIGKLIDDERFKRNFRLIGQIEGSAGSIMDNIAEGFERGGNKEFVQFLYIGKASCGELRSQLYRALDREYITAQEFELFSSHAMRISSLIQKLITYLSNTEIKGTKYKARENSKAEKSTEPTSSQTS
jgi:four helix bundle protein